MQQHAATFFAQTEAATGADLPRFVKHEFDSFLECGILAHGFLRLRCSDCGHDKLVAFSDKRRGFCPSCGARRMAQTAAHLVDHAIPHVPVRQWVLSLPIPLRLLPAAHTAQAGDARAAGHASRDHPVLARAGGPEGRQCRQRRGRADSSLRIGAARLDCVDAEVPRMR